jgi:hypothetical protein
MRVESPKGCIRRSAAGAMNCDGKTFQAPYSIMVTASTKRM